jgi:PAS domain S-box-containing protein
MVILWLQNRKHFSGTAFWVFNFAFQTIALILISLRGIIPDWISMVLSNTLVISGNILALMGIERFAGVKGRHLHNYILLAVFIFIHAWFAISKPDLPARELNLGTAFLLISLQICWLVFFRLKGELRRLTLGVGIVFLFYSLINLARIVNYFTADNLSNDYFQSGFFGSSMLIFYQMLFIILAYTLVLKFNKRLLNDLKINSEALVESQALLQTAMDCSPVGIAIADAPSGRIRYVNKAGLLITANSVDVIVKDIDINKYVGSWKIKHHDGTPFEPDEVPLARAVLYGETNSREFIITRDDNTDRIVLANAAPVLDDSRNVTAGIVVFQDITERKRSELALKESEEKFRNLFEHSPVGKSMTGVDGSLNVNKAFCKILGYSESELKAKHWKEISHPDDIPLAEEMVKSLLEGKTASVRFEKRYLHKNGSIVYTDVSTYLQRDNEGNPQYFITTINNITDRKLAEAKLIASEERYSLIISASEQGIWDWNIKTSEVFFSEQWKKQIGYEDHEIENSFSSWIDLIHPDETEYCQLAVQSYLNNPVEHFILEFRFRHKNGSYRWIHNKSASVKDEDENVIRMFGTHTDITERKQAEEEIKKTGQHYQALIEKAPDGIALIDAEGNFKYISPSAKKMFGYIPTDEISGHPAEYTHPDDLQMVISELGKLTGDPTYVPTIKYRFIDKFGYWHWVETTFSNLLANTSVAAIVLNFRDITQRKQLDEVNTFLSTSGYPGSDKSFFESLAKYLSEILDSEYVCIDKLDGDGLTAQTVAIYNKGNYDPNVSYTLKQTPCGDVVGKAICCFPENVCQLFPHDEALQDLKAHSYIGTTLWSFDGKPIGLIAIIGQKPLKQAAFAENVLKLVAIRAAGELERMQAEEHIRKLNETLEHRVIERTSQLNVANKELEAFSYSVSHDLRAPLRAIHSFTSILKEDYNDILNDEGKRICGIIETSSVHMGQLIDDLLSFSRIGRTELQNMKIDMTKMAKTVCSELSGTDEMKRINFRLEKLPFAFGDSATIKQVLINLISNAINYTAKNETPEIVVGFDKSCIPSAYYVKDNGVGFDMQYVSKLFGVFQRLHSSREFEGNGVGLAIVQRIIHRHGGKVWAEGEVGKGATFFFTLPDKGQ